MADVRVRQAMCVAQSLCLLVFVASGAAAGQIPKTYHVAVDGDDRGDGSAKKPWRTPAVALKKVPDEAAQILVHDGVYTGVLVVMRKFTEPVVLRPEHPYRAQLRNKDAVVQIRDAANVEIAEFDIARTPPEGKPTPLAVHIARSQGIILRGNLIHDSYNNDLLKINESASDVLITENVFRNQEGPAGQHIDVNGCHDIFITGNIFFNDFAGTGVDGSTSHGFVVIKNSGDAPESRRVQVAANIFLNFEGSSGSNVILMGEDSKPVYEAQEILIENNLIIGNSRVQMRAPLGGKGVRDVIFRNNTITGDLPAHAYAMRLNQEGRNPPNLNLSFMNNIWSDPTGTMANFSDGRPDEAKQLKLSNNGFWNGGREIPRGEGLKPQDDKQAIEGDPKLPWPAKIVLPNWKDSSFASSTTTFRQEFERLVREFGVPGPDSSLLGRADSSAAPAMDILGAVRGSKPDIGAVQRDGVLSALQVRLFPGHVFSGGKSLVNRVVLKEPAPASGVVVKLAVRGPAAVSPAQVFIPAGETSASFAMEAKPVTTEASAIVSATAGGQRSEAALLVVPQGVVSVNPSSSTIWAGESEHVLMLEGPLSSGTAIELTSSQPDLVSFDAAEPVEGRACARFRMRVKPVREATPLTITGAIGERRSSITITIRPGQAVTSLKLDQTHAFNGAKVTGTVGVAEPAPPGQEVVVQLSTEDPAVIVVPPTVRVPSGQISATFPIETKPMRGRRKSIGIVAKVNDNARTQWLVVGAAEPQIVSLYPPKTGNRGMGMIRLSAPAPAGFRCSISSSQPGQASVPDEVPFDENSYRAGFPINLQPGVDLRQINITVTCNGVTQTGVVPGDPPK
jgi:hypothetical protein